MSDSRAAKTAVYGMVAILSTLAVYLAMRKYVIAKDGPTIKKSRTASDLEWKEVNSVSKVKRILILYGTTTGTAKTFAHKLFGKLSGNGRSGPEVEVCNICDYDEEQLSQEDVVLILSSTWIDGEPPVACRGFFDYLKDVAYDFRVSKSLLSRVRYAIFGLGGELYNNNFCKAPRDMHLHMNMLGATPLADITVGDDASDLEEKFGRWSALIVSILLCDMAAACSTTVTNNDADGEDVGTSKRQQKKSKRNLEIQQKKKLEANYKKDTNGKRTSKGDKNAKSTISVSPAYANNNKMRNASSNSSNSTEISSGISHEQEINNKVEEEGEEEEEEEEEDRINNNFVDMDEVEVSGAQRTAVSDLEDMGSEIMQAKSSVVSAANATNGEGISGTGSSSGGGEALKEALTNTTGEVLPRREMVTKLQRKALTKEGYRIIGTHSAVKICRWTKNQLRGRGGCYKHTFYGITSYQCMEATPSLACANKCVFCWRHHKNPVGTEWRWKEDSPDEIVAEAVRLHVGMVNEMKGVPGVVPERLQEAYTVRHCALSLVGKLK